MARSKKPGTRRSKKPVGVTIDFSDIGERFEPKNEYHVVVTEVEIAEGEKAPYFKFTLTGAEGTEQSGSTLYHIASTSPNSLWRLRDILKALGIDVPSGALDINPAELVGLECMVGTYGEEYDGQVRTKIDEFWPVGAESDSGDDEGEDAEEADESEEGSDDDECPEIDDLSDDQVKEMCDFLKLKARGVAKLRAKLEAADDDDLDKAWAEVNGDDEEEAEEEAEDVSEDDIKGMSEEELGELIEEHDLEVELDDHKTLRKKKAAVVKAARDAELID